MENEVVAMRFERVLFPVDFSDYSRACLDRASSIFAQDRPAEVHFLYVLGTPSDFSSWEGDPRRLVHERLREVVAEFHHEGGYESRIAIRFGHAATEICRYANEKGSDLIVMATHGRTGLRHMLLGSTAEQVVRHAPCPVLTLRVLPKAR